MDPKHVSLVKKAIRMIDYMRADLVGILGEVGERTDHGRDEPRIAVADTPSPLYAAFDVPFRDKALPDPEPIGLISAETDEASDPVEVDPVENTDPELSPAAPEITEYERLKRRIHAQHGTALFRQNETMVCCAQHAPFGVSCQCPKCLGNG